MNVALKNLPYGSVYLDDSVIFSEELPHYTRQLTDILDGIPSGRFRLKLIKCKFSCDECQLVENFVLNERIQGNFDKIPANVDVLTPTVKDRISQLPRPGVILQTLHQEFRKNWSSITCCYYVATRLGLYQLNPCSTTLAEEKALWSSTSGPLDFHKPFIVDTEASSLAVGMVLAQKDENKNVHENQFTRRTTNTMEQIYDVGEKEALAAVFSSKKFLHYLLIAEIFTLSTPHWAVRSTFEKWMWMEIFWNGLNWMLSTS